jgi:hypothetical protein
MNKQNDKQNNYTIYVKKHPFASEKVRVTIQGRKCFCSCEQKGKCSHITQALEFYALLKLARVPESIL